MADSFVLGVVAAVSSFAGAWGGLKVHLYYIRRDLEAATRSARKAHWRLDVIGAPPSSPDDGR